MTKKSKKIVIFLEHETKKPIRARLKTKGLKGAWFFGRLAKYLGQGYKLARIEGDPENPIYQKIKGYMDSYEETGKVKVTMKETYALASEISGTSIKKIEERVEKQLNKFRKRFKGVTR